MSPVNFIIINSPYSPNIFTLKYTQKCMRKVQFKCLHHQSVSYYSTFLIWKKHSDDISSTSAIAFWIRNIIKFWTLLTLTSDNFKSIKISGSHRENLPTSDVLKWCRPLNPPPFFNSSKVFNTNAPNDPLRTNTLHSKCFTIPSCQKLISIIMNRSAVGASMFLFLSTWINIAFKIVDGIRSEWCSASR